MDTKMIFTKLIPMFTSLSTFHGKCKTQFQKNNSKNMANVKAVSHNFQTDRFLANRQTEHISAKSTLNSEQSEFGFMRMISKNISVGENGCKGQKSEQQQKWPYFWRNICLLLLQFESCSRTSISLSSHQSSLQYPPLRAQFRRTIVKNVGSLCSWFASRSSC